MPRRVYILLFTFTIVVATALPAVAQLLPESTPKPPKPPAAKPAQIVVQTSPNAEVYFDDEYRGRAGSEGRLVIASPKPGEHNLRVSLTGKKDFQQKITVVAGKELKVPATLADLPGSILVTTTPGAEVSLDNSSRGAADANGHLTVPDLAAGAHALRITAHGKKDLSQTVNVSSGQEARVEAALADLSGSILVITAPGAEVSLDNSSRGTANANGQLAVSDVAAGAHALRIMARGKTDFTQTVNVTSGQETRVGAALLDLGPPTRREVRENPNDGLKYVWIPSGSFMMGCSRGEKKCFADEKPSHQVTMSKGFWIGQTEVTAGAYKRFAAATGRQMPVAPRFNSRWANENMPIVNVTWEDSREYCARAGGRLLTEAEWEYAARAGSTVARYGNIDEIAWYSQNSGEQTHEVAQRRANDFGLFDMLGNVWEWVSDWYDDKYYQNSPSQDPRGPTGGQLRVLRGGSWSNPPTIVRVSYRFRLNPADRNYNLGFRCGGEVVKP
jgi:formylglycine-generating enzyme required for sulfatase activity